MERVFITRCAFTPAIVLAQVMAGEGAGVTALGCSEASAPEYMLLGSDF